MHTNMDSYAQRMTQLSLDLARLRDALIHLSLGMKDFQFEFGMDPNNSVIADVTGTLNRIAQLHSESPDVRQPTASAPVATTSPSAAGRTHAARRFSACGPTVFENAVQYATADWPPDSTSQRAQSARRVAACLEACKGIDTVSLEENGVASMESIQNVLNELSVLRMTRERIAQACEATLANPQVPLAVQALATQIRSLM